MAERKVALIPRTKWWYALFFILPVLLASVLFAGCAKMDFATLRPGIESRGHYIEGVPFYRQEEGSCGPAALAAVTSFWGMRMSLQEITAKVYLPKLRGSLPMDMENFLRDKGFVTTSTDGSLDELKAQVRKNVPVISLLDLGFWLYRQPHYVTVIGYDDASAVVIVHDGLTANKVIGYGRFLREWGRAGNWMLVAVPKTASAEEKR